MENLFLYILLLIIVIAAGATYFAKKHLKKKREQLEKIMQIPPEIMEQFELAEKVLKESHGQISPHKILWDLSNDRINMKGGKNGNKNESKESRGTETTDTGRDNSSIVPAEPAIQSGESGGELEGRNSIQNATPTVDNVDNGQPKQLTPNNKRNFWDKFRRKNDFN